MKKEIINGIEWTILEGNDSFIARGSSHVVARGSSHVVARESSHVEAWGSSHVEAWGSSHVVAWESSHVEARESSHVEAMDFSAIYQLSSNSKIKKGSKATIIKPNYPKNIREWAKMKGLKINKNRINLFKVLRLNGTDFYSGTINYLENAIAPDWDAKFKEECGYGLHLADSPEGARYFLQDRNNYLLIEVSADIKDCIAFGGQPRYPMKLRARACKFVRIIERVENGINIPL